MEIVEVAEINAGKINMRENWQQLNKNHKIEIMDKWIEFRMKTGPQ